MSSHTDTEVTRMTATTTRLTGEVVRAADPGYEVARIGWNRLYSRYPEAVVFCADTQDVVNAVTWAREEGVALRARSGRHNIEGWSSLDGGVVLGGGFGLLTRSLGLACDNLLAAEIVVADGPRSAKVIEVSEHCNADLLWACRGGGGNNFGIATSYTLKLNELSHVEFVIARWTGHDHLGELLRAWQRDAPVADERLTSALEVDSTAIELSAVLHGGSRQELDEQLRSLLAIGKPDLTYMNDAWPSIYQHVDRAPDLPFWKFYSQFVTSPFLDQAIDLIVHYMANTPSPPSNFFCSSFGGAVRQAPPGGSAFPHRDALFYCEPGAAWDDPALHSKALGWAAEFWRALRPFGDGAYVNVPNAPASDWEHEYYGSNVERLRQVKATYDPQNVFRFEQSIPAPSTG